MPGSAPAFGASAPWEPRTVSSIQMSGVEIQSFKVDAEYKSFKPARGSGGNARVRGGASGRTASVRGTGRGRGGGAARGGGGSTGMTRGRGPAAVQETIVLMYNKRKGLVTTHADELGRTTVYDDLAASLPPHLKRERWHAVGRLDADTTGLLLMTNDGTLVHHATQPGTKLPKSYLAVCAGPLCDHHVESLRAGVELSGGLGRSGEAVVEVLEHHHASSLLRITITEGKNRQIRRMLEAVGSQVMRLERVAVGRIEMDSQLEPGAWRMLTNAEVKRGLDYEPKTL